ncbi:MAG: GIDE domain-containing protein [Myxococcota bacterium]
MGGLLLIIGLAVLGFGLMQHLKGKRILAAPFKKTGDIAKNPVSEDPKGAMSTEGRVLPPAQALLSPASKTPCLYYELKIERIYEKTETTQDGTKTVKGTETLDTIKGGSVFALDDGSGRVEIDVTKGADFDNMKDGYKKELNGWGGSSHVQFGEYSYDVPVIGSDKGWTIGFKATEKYVPVEGNLFVLGKLEGSKLVKPGWRSMLASNKGREGLLGSIQKKKKFSFIGGGIAAVLSIPVMIFGPQPDPNAPSMFCESALTDTRVKCDDNVSSVSGEEYSWTVTKPGQYELEVFAPAKKVAFDPQIIVKDATGTVVADVEGGVGSNAKATVDAKAGKYTITVKPGDEYMVKGGFSYELEIRSLSAPAAAPVAAAAAGEEAPAPAAEAAPADGAPYSAAQLAERVEYLNELCPDTYCEGEFEFNFTKLTCDAKDSCELSFTAESHDTHKKYTSAVAVKGFDKLVLSDSDDFKWEGSFDEKVSNALLDWEMKPVNGAPKAKASAKAAPAKKSASAKIAAPKATPKAKNVAKAKSPQPKAAPAPARAAPSSPAVKRSNKNLAD